LLIEAVKELNKKLSKWHSRDILKKSLYHHL
jgi:hypothetical protein